MVKDDGTTAATGPAEQTGGEERAPRTRLGRRIRVFPPKAARRIEAAGEAMPGVEAHGAAALAMLEDLPADADASRPGGAEADAVEPETATEPDTMTEPDTVMESGATTETGGPVELDDSVGSGAVAEPDVTARRNGEAAEPSAPVPAAGASGSRRPPSFSLLFQAPPTPTADPSAEGLSPDLDEIADDDTDERDEDASASGAATSSRRSRRRSRGRTGTAEEETGEPAAEVVTRTRPSRELITEPQKLKGSTRLEAKRQRRRDGRDAGRRRTVVTEAEFLARREAVDRVMIVRSDETHIEIGVLEDGILAEHYLAKNANVSLIGNVYLGRVQNVLPSMEAAFVDIGRGRNAVLYSGEVDWDAASDRLGDKGSQARRIELALKSGDRVLVQVTKDPIGHKGSRLTSSISLPGRYLVYVPNGSMNGISRKLPDTERTRLKRILKDALPDSAGVIVRTAAEGAAEEQLTVDIQRLANQWAEIEHLTETATAPALLHSEPDLLVKIVRDVFNEDFAKLVIAGDDARETIERYLTGVAPELLDRVERWQGDGDVFASYRVGEQIEKALDRKVWLPSGGSLVIDRTEAMTVIDVNTGKFVGSGGNLEETVTKNNLEAAEEIVRQLRLRDIGGIIVVDFIDMVLESNRDLVLRRLVECLSRDRTKHQVAEVTSLGLVQMTRKRLGIGLAESMSDETVAADNRPDPQAPGRRRRGGGQQEKQPPRPAGSTHVITDGAKTALAQIAGATIVTPVRADQEPETLGAPAEPVAVPDVARSGRTGRRASQPTQQPTGSSPQPQPLSVPTPQTPPAPEGPPEPQGPPQPQGPPEPQPALSSAPQPDAQPAPLIDLPSTAQQPPRVQGVDEAAAGLLDSVLVALPEPKRPGQGRRSRRVSTPALTPKQQD